MNTEEFASVMAYIGVGCSKPLSADALEVYFDLLGDLPAEALQVAAKRVILEHRWPTFPSVAELREAASETIRGRVADLSPAEAWNLAWKAASRIDLEDGFSLKKETSKLPTLVVEAMNAFGIPDLCYGKEPVGVLRGQFVKIYEQLAAREKRAALLPAPVKRAIEANGKPLTQVLQALAWIVKPVEEAKETA